MGKGRCVRGGDTICEHIIKLLRCLLCLLCPVYAQLFDGCKPVCNLLGSTNFLHCFTGYAGNVVARRQRSTLDVVVVLVAINIASLHC